jgi:integrase
VSACADFTYIATLFPGGKVGKHLSNMAMLTAVSLGHADITAHGFRATFRMWVAEQTSFEATSWIKDAR